MHTTTWGSKDTNESEQLLEMILECNLNIHNVFNSLRFVMKIREDILDNTLSTANPRDLVTN